MTIRVRMRTEAEDRERSEYFYDLLEQLPVVGRQAGGDAVTDALLIGGLVARRRKAAAAH